MLVAQQLSNARRKEIKITEQMRERARELLQRDRERLQREQPQREQREEQLQREQIERRERERERIEGERRERERIEGERRERRERERIEGERREREEGERRERERRERRERIEIERERVERIERRERIERERRERRERIERIERIERERREMREALRQEIYDSGSEYEKPKKKTGKINNRLDNIFSLITKWQHIGSDKKVDLHDDDIVDNFSEIIDSDYDSEEENEIIDSDYYSEKENKIDNYDSKFEISEAEKARQIKLMKKYEQLNLKKIEHAKLKAKKQKEIKLNGVECGICCDIKLKNNFVHFECSHSMCSTCSANLFAEPSRGGYINLFPACPMCKHNLSIVDMHNSLDALSAVKRFMQIRTAKDIQLKKNEYYCSCSKCEKIFTGTATCESDLSHLPTMCMGCFDKTENYDEKNKTRCSSCLAPYVRYDGCNIITCTICGSYTCHTCGKQLNGEDDDDDTYKHYPHGDTFMPCINVQKSKSIKSKK